MSGRGEYTNLDDRVSGACLHHQNPAAALPNNGDTHTPLLPDGPGAELGSLKSLKKFGHQVLGLGGGECGM